MNTVNVIVQYFRGCPNSDEMIQRVRSAIVGIENVNYEEVLVETEEAAKRNGFRGSPTLLINSEDFENAPVPSIPSLSCRFYPKGLPTVEQIREKILSAMQ